MCSIPVDLMNASPISIKRTNHILHVELVRREQLVKLCAGLIEVLTCLKWQERNYFASFVRSKPEFMWNFKNIFFLKMCEAWMVEGSDRFMLKYLNLHACSVYLPSPKCFFASMTKPFWHILLGHMQLCEWWGALEHFMKDQTFVIN